MLSLCFSKSSTFQNLYDPISITYYDIGKASATIGADVVYFAGTSRLKQTFALIKKPPSGFAYMPADGIVGVAWPPLADHRTVPPITSLGNVFTLWLDGNVLPSGSIGGEVIFNGLDTTHCDSSAYNYVRTSRQTYWQIPAGSFSVKDYKFPQPQQAIVDSGSWWIAFPPAQIFAVVDATNAVFRLFEGIYTVDCNADLPDIVVTINGLAYAIKKEQYTVPLGQGVCWLRINFFDIATTDPMTPTAVLGQPFLKNRCIAFDIGQQRVGIAAPKK